MATVRFLSVPPIVRRWRNTLLISVNIIASEALRMSIGRFSRNTASPLMNDMVGIDARGFAPFRARHKPGSGSQGVALGYHISAPRAVNIPSPDAGRYS